MASHAFLVLAAAWPISVGAFLCAVAALVVAWLLHVAVTSRSDGGEPARLRLHELRERSATGLAIQARLMVGVVAFVLIVLLTTARGAADRWTAWAFVVGALLVSLSRWLHGKVMPPLELRVVEAARTSLASAVDTAYCGGAVVAFGIAGLGLGGICLFWFITGEPPALFGFALGASALALLARAFGGHAGTALELFESRVAAIAATMALGAASVTSAGFSLDDRPGLVVLPLGVAGVGILASIVGRRFVAAEHESELEPALLKSWFVTALLFSAASLALVLLADREPLAKIGAARQMARWGGVGGLFGAIVAGLVGGLSIGRMMRYAESQPEPGALLRVAAMALPMLLIAAVVLAAWCGAGAYGVALAAVGMLAPLQTGVEHCVASTEQDPLEQRALSSLAAAGRATAALTRGVGIGSAALTALALVQIYSRATRIATLDLLDPDVVVGLLVGTMLPFVFTAIAARAAWREAPTSTSGALRAMIGPALIAAAAPLCVGRLNRAALGGMLAGVLVCGVMLALHDSAAVVIDRRSKSSNQGAMDALAETHLEPALGTLIRLVCIVAVVAAQSER